MIENLKIGCTVSKDQLSRIPVEGLTVDNVLDKLDFDRWYVEYDQDGHPSREEFENANAAKVRYDELKTLEEFDVMKGFLLGSIGDLSKWYGVSENG